MVAAVVKRPSEPPRERWFILKHLRPSPMPKAEIDAFVKRFINAPKPPEPPEAA